MFRASILTTLIVWALGSCPAAAADPVGTWAMTGRVRTTVCAGGRCQTAAEAGSAVITIAADGSYRSPSALAGCDSLPDEVGTWAARPRGGFTLRASNVSELLDAIRTCLRANGLTLTGRFTTSFFPSNDGTSARFRTRFAGRGRFRGVSFTATAGGRYSGQRTSPTARRFVDATDGTPPVGAISAVLAAIAR